ncbi:hypothetical protein AB0C29_49845 [Actinoplanes sp. NPDC048791]|uniref:hypothetical protein n=1 Tax=Actinoplanes sp. NPDC048791 TaxID=3154623 RepID=UPI00340AAB44
MSTIILGRRTPPAGRVSGGLGRVEARRMMRHPAYWVGLAWFALLSANLTIDVVRGRDEIWNALYGVTLLGACLLYAPLTVVSANRVAAATFRRQVREPLDAAPVDARQRTVGTMLGLLRGPVLVGVAAMVVMSVVAPLTEPTAGDPANGSYGRGVLEHLQVPVLVLGAGLLGIALARWVPVPGALPLVVLTLWFGTGAIYAAADAGGAVHAPTWFAPWIMWAAENAGPARDQPLGQEMWHLAYLLGLSLLAGAAALLRTPGNRKGLWCAAAAAVVVTGLAGWQQLG